MDFLVTALNNWNPVRRKVNLVYTIKPGSNPLQPKTSKLVSWTVITPGVVSVMLARDSARQVLMHDYLRRGYTGVLLHSDLIWVAYGWLSKTSDLPPLSFPKSQTLAPGAWIFDCQTREFYRNRGLLKEVLQLLIMLAWEGSCDTPLYIASPPDNFPARHAIQTVGFSPCGVLTTWSVGFFGVWQRDSYQPSQFHPPL